MMYPRIRRALVYASICIFTQHAAISFSIPCTRFGLQDIYTHVTSVIHEAQESLATLSSDALSQWLCQTPYENIEASIRWSESDHVCDAEHTYRAKRKAYIQPYFEQLLHRSLDAHKIPTIALCCSGGGYRAMLLTLGFLKGLHATGILDCTTYMTGLSGSSWAMAPWVASQKNLDDYLETLSDKLCSGLETVKKPRHLATIAKQLITKVVHGQHISMIDISGPILANTLLADLGSNKFVATLSETHAYVADGSLPLPIYTAVSPNIDPYAWFEFSPFEVGSSYTHAYIPTWAFGRKFKNGVSVNHAPEQPLGYMMGIFGSAFAFDIQDAVRQTSQEIQSVLDTMPRMLANAASTIIDKLVNSPLDEVRLAPSSLPNFTYQSDSLLMQEDKRLTLMDAGIYFNIPFPPMLRAERTVDIIIVYDASSSIEGCINLHWAQEYMQQHNLLFPPIDFERADKQVMTIFKDENNPYCPIVIYFPRIKNLAYSQSFDPDACLDDYCATMNFTFDEHQIDELMGLSEFAVVQHLADIKDVILEVALR